MPKIEIYEQCKPCKGTGLYIGCGERDSIAVVCHNCKGTGKYHFKYEYELFEERLPSSKDIKRVIQSNPGFTVGEVEGDISWVGGMTIEDWLSGKKFVEGMEMRTATCPAWWYQTVDYARKPHFEKCKGFGSFSSCENFCNKDGCWKRWDREFGNKAV